MKVYTYTPTHRGCREGIAVCDPAGDLHDTFWDSGYDRHRLTPAEEATAVLIFDTDEYIEVGRYQRTAPTQWTDRHPTDRATITGQHGLVTRWFIRRDSRPSPAQRTANARAAVEAARATADNANRALERAQATLAALLAEQTDPRTDA